MAMFVRKRPTAHSPNTAPVATNAPQRRRHASHAKIGRNRRAFVTFENVAMPSNAAAAISPAGVKSQRVPLTGLSRGAASLYNQQKYARRPSEKLKSSGVIQTKYTGTMDAMTNAPVIADASNAFMRVSR